MMDYKEIMKSLLAEYYKPEDPAGTPLHMTTGALLDMFRGIIPAQPISEHDVFELLQELGYRQEQKIFYEKVLISEGDHEAGIMPEYDNVEVARRFMWVLYELPE